MLCNGKYYIGCSPNIQLQVSKEEHERIRALRNEPLVELALNSLLHRHFTWIDDPTCEPST